MDTTQSGPRQVVASVLVRVPKPMKSASGLGSVTLFLALILMAGGCGRGGIAPEKPNIILVTVESLRPDHLASFGGPRKTTPNLDQLAEESVVYEDAHSVTSWTLASHASIFTGLYPSAHGANQSRSELGEMSTLARILSEEGYQTAGFASGPYLSRNHKLDQGFEFYDDSPATLGTQGGAHRDITNPKMLASIKRFLQRDRAPGKPLFLFGYFWDPHYDYIPPPPYDKIFVDEESTRVEVRGYESNSMISDELEPDEIRYIESQYDGELLWTDHMLQELFDLLKESDLWDDSFVIITSDHGEEFFDHGNKGHKKTLYVESVHVPLIIKFPDSIREGRDDRLVSLVDLFPTILDAAGVESRPVHQGFSLLEPDQGVERPIFFELLASTYSRKEEGPGYNRRDEEWYAVRQGNEKLITVPMENRSEYYLVDRDPREVYDVAITDRERVAELQEVLDQWLEESKEIGASRAFIQADLSEDQLERLRALGYLEAVAPAESSSPAARD